MVVGIVERRRRVEIEDRQTAHAVGPGQQLVVLGDGASALLLGAREQDRDRVQVLTGQAADPMLGRRGAGVTEDVRPGRHPLAELVGKAGQGLVVDAECAQPIPGERQR